MVHAWIMFSWMPLLNRFYPSDLIVYGVVEVTREVVFLSEIFHLFISFRLGIL